MKLTCPISGIAWTAEYPLVGYGKVPHPLISAQLSPAKLSELYLESWSSGELSDEECSLLALAYSVHLPLEELPHISSLEMHKSWLVIVSNCMERLARVSDKVYCTGDMVTKKLPKFRFSADNLRFFRDYLSELEIAYRACTSPITPEARKANSDSRALEYKESQESLLIRGLRGSPLKPKEHGKFATAITAWTEKSAPFPLTTVTLPNGQRTTLAAVFRQIMTATFSKAGAYELLGTSITPEEVDLLLMHLHEFLDSSSIHASVVLAQVAETLEILQEFKSPSYLANNAASILLEENASDLLDSLGSSVQSTPVKHSKVPQSHYTSTGKVAASDESIAKTKSALASLQAKLAAAKARKLSN